MGRRQTIDREQILDAAEQVVMREGAAHLTIEAVAAEAGVSKGGVLYSFASKDALIDALHRRIISGFDQIVEKVIATLGDTPENRIRGHVIANFEHDESVNERIAGLIVNFIRSPQYRAEANEYYRDLVGKLDASTPTGKKLRLALLATEGAFMLRGFDFYPIGPEEWRQIHQDIIDYLLP